MTFNSFYKILHALIVIPTFLIVPMKLRYPLMNLKKNLSPIYCLIYRYIVLLAKLPPIYEILAKISPIYEILAKMSPIYKILATYLPRITRCKKHTKMYHEILKLVPVKEKKPETKTENQETNTSQLTKMKTCMGKLYYLHSIKLFTPIYTQFNQLFIQIYNLLIIIYTKLYNIVYKIQLSITYTKLFIKIIYNIIYKIQ